jgi:hypothetical protein
MTNHITSTPTRAAKTLMDQRSSTPSNKVFLKLNCEIKIERVRWRNIMETETSNNTKSLLGIWRPKLEILAHHAATKDINKTKNA